MRKISEVITEVIMRQSFLEEALRYGFLNLTSFSEYIRPYVETETQKTVSVHAIKMTLSRIQKKNLQEIGHRNSVKFQKISTCADLSLMTFARTPSNILMITSLMNERKEKASRFFTIIEWMHEIDMIFASEDRAMIDSHIHHTIPTLVLEHLWLVTCEVEDDEITTPGLFYEVTKGFAFHAINIVQMLSTTHELGIIVREEDMKRAMGVLMSN